MSDTIFRPDETRMKILAQSYKKYISFADPDVFTALKSISTDGKGITYADAARITRFNSNWTRNNTNINTFDEFQYFTGLTASNWQLTSSGTFYGCNYLTSIVIPAGIPIFGSYCFQSCGNATTSGLTLKILRTSSVITGGTNMLRYAKINKILVPSSLVESYKTADKWSSFATYIEGY